MGDTEGLRVASLMKGGSLLPDELLVSTVQQALDLHPPEHMLLCDGVIRTLAQMKLLAPVWVAYGLDAPTLIFLDLDEETARARVAQRHAERHLPEKREYHATFSGKFIQREDDNPQALEERLRLFRQMTEPIVAAFQSEGRVASVSADQTVKEVHLQVCQAISTFYPTLNEPDQIAG